MKLYEQDAETLERERIMAEYHRVQAAVDIQERTCDLCRQVVDCYDDLDTCGQCQAMFCPWCATGEPQLCVGCDDA